MKGFLITLGVAVALSGCSSQPNYVMGSSKADMENLQTYNLNAVNNPPEGIVAGLDGSVGENIINRHRNTEAAPIAVEQDVEFTMGKENN